MKLIRFSLVALSGAALVSCTATQQQWGLGGAAAGAAGGAILGDDSSDIVRGAVIGGAGGVGAAAYKENQNRTAPPVSQNQVVQPAPTKPTRPKLFGGAPAPSATVTNVPGIVVSPFPPYNKVNVTGFKSGSKARDPYTKQIFLVP